MYMLFLFITLAILIATCFTAWSRSQDILHPAMLLCMPLGALYVVQPLLLVYRDEEKLFYYLNESQLLMVTSINLCGVIAICLGAVGPSSYLRPKRGAILAADNDRLRYVGILLGLFGVLSYLYCIALSGGFYNAYGSGYGGGWSNIGYLREAYWVTVPAITLVAISRRKLILQDYFWFALFTFPLLFHGLVGGRRGPTAVALLTIWLSRTLATGRRPAVVAVFLGMATIGFVMLALVSNRGSLHLGGDVNLDRGIESYATSAGSSNEFIYGGGIIVTSWHQGVVYYGMRYVAVIFIRPIPRQLFSNKYQFAADYLGIPNLEEKGVNMGTGNLNFRRYCGWVSAQGAAPGLIADLWLEFSLAYVIALWLIGRFYWFGWHRAMIGNRFWGIGYIVMTALSIYLVTQTLEAMLFRFILVIGFVCVTWYIAEGRLPEFNFRILTRRFNRRRITRLP